MLSFLQRDRHTDRDYTCLCLRGGEKRELVCVCVRASHRHITLYCKHIILDYQNTTKTNKQTKSKSTGPFYNHCHSLKIQPFFPHKRKGPTLQAFQHPANVIRKSFSNLLEIQCLTALHTHLGGVHPRRRFGIERGHVGVSSLHRFLGGRAVVDAAHHFGVDQRTWGRHPYWLTNPAPCPFTTAVRTQLK